LFDGGSPVVAVTPTRLERVDNGDALEVESAGRFRYVDEYGTVDIYDRVESATPTLEELRSFAGQYVSDEIDTTVTLAIDGGRLGIQRSPENIPFTPVYKDAFSARLGFIVFERDQAGQVRAFTLTEERVWNLRFARRAAGNVASASPASK
jgi:hypothetical protein